MNTRRVIGPWTALLLCVLIGGSAWAAALLAIFN